jgi:hypothetical protein
MSWVPSPYTKKKRKKKSAAYKDKWKGTFAKGGTDSRSTSPFWQTRHMKTKKVKGDVTILRGWNRRFA